jgi:metallo-beta-lactamase family protein
MEVVHHGAFESVTGSCHELKLNEKRSILIDCGMFQGKDAKIHSDEIEFPLEGVMGLVVTHIHIDHVGRIPFLIAAGFNGPIYCSPPTAKLLPLVLEDAMRVGVTRNRRLIERFLMDLRRHIRPIPFHKWQDLDGGLRMRLSPAGHVLGSAYVEFDYHDERFVFSGDLGTRDQPLLNPPVSPEKADLLVLESTYGDRLHEGRDGRVARLEAILIETLKNHGVTIIPAFSVGRTQELLFELNGIIDGLGRPPNKSLLHAVDIIIDSPLAQKFTEIYESLTNYWSDEAKQVLTYDDEPFVFQNLVSMDDFEEHRHTINYLKKSKLPAIVIAASGMCAGGRVVDYLKEFLGTETTDVVFIGFQALGTPGRYIQDTDWVMLEGQRYDIKARRYTLSGYSAHADQADLIRFVEEMEKPPKAIRLVHGEAPAKEALTRELVSRGYKLV